MSCKLNINITSAPTVGTSNHVAKEHPLTEEKVKWGIYWANILPDLTVSLPTNAVVISHHPQAASYGAIYYMVPVEHA